MLATDEDRYNYFVFLSVSTQQPSESHSHFTVYNEFIGLNSTTMCYMFRLIKPSSSSTH
jgi:hypothetical protein